MHSPGRTAALECAQNPCYSGSGRMLTQCHFSCGCADVFLFRVHSFYGCLSVQIHPHFTNLWIKISVSYRLTDHVELRHGAVRPGRLGGRHARDTAAPGRAGYPSAPQAPGTSGAKDRTSITVSSLLRRGVIVSVIRGRCDRVTDRHRHMSRGVEREGLEIERWWV